MNQRTTALHVEGTPIRLNENFISLTDMCRGFKGDSTLIADWLRNRNTLEYVKTWEQINNPDFNYGEFAIIENKSGLNTFKVSAGELVEACGVCCLQVSKGRYGDLKK
jgi:hypothetical protein